MLRNLTQRLPLTWVRESDSKWWSDQQISGKEKPNSKVIKRSVGIDRSDSKKVCSVGHNQEIGSLKEKFGVRKSDPKNYPSSSTTQKWWTERKIWGPKIGLKNKNNSA